MNHTDAQAALRAATTWRKSTYSFPDGQECVEIATDPSGWVGVRDSKLGSSSPVLAVTAQQWQAVVGRTCGTEPHV